MEVQVKFKHCPNDTVFILKNNCITKGVVEKIVLEVTNGSSCDAIYTINIGKTYIGSRPITCDVRENGVHKTIQGVTNDLLKEYLDKVNDSVGGQE